MRRAVVLVIVLGMLAAVVALWKPVGRESQPFPDVPAQTATTPQTAATTQGTPTAAGDGGMLYLYDAPESPMDIRYQYHWEILRTALERTKAKWGPYRMEPAAFMGESRQTFELKNATGKLTVMYLGTSPDLEAALTPVRIPVDKNLGGYMVMLIRKEDQEKFAAVQSLDDLKKFRIGLGLGWLDVDILRADGFNVVTGSSYEGLFEMLANRRFDAFSRAAVEILGEFDARHGQIPDMAIEQTFILYYPLPMYFWFTHTPEGQRLADRAREGMLAMLDDGTYDQIFFRYQQAKIDHLHLSSRKVFRVQNPLLKTLPVPFDDKRLWFDPTAAR